MRWSFPITSETLGPMNTIEEMLESSRNAMTPPITAPAFGPIILTAEIRTISTSPFISEAGLESRNTTLRRMYITVTTRVESSSERGMVRLASASSPEM